MSKKSIAVFVGTVIGLALFTTVGPAEKTLGVNARVVYLHGAWVWAALAFLLLAGIIGVAGLVTRRARWHRWSRALGRTGLLFWITYLPISLWAMQTNWNGLFLAEPRWRVAVVFAVAGVLAQAGVTLLENPAWASGLNAAYIAALLLVLQNTDKVMHPPSPMLDSDAWRIQLFFAGLCALVLGLAAQVARWWHRMEQVVTLPASPGNEFPG